MRKWELFVMMYLKSHTLLREIFNWRALQIVVWGNSMVRSKRQYTPWKLAPERRTNLLYWPITGHDYHALVAHLHRISVVDFPTCVLRDELRSQEVHLFYCEALLELQNIVQANLLNKIILGYKRFHDRTSMMHGIWKKKFEVP